MADNDRRGSDATTPAMIRRRLAVVGVYIVAGVVTVAVAAGLALPQSAVASTALALALGTVIAASRLEEVRSTAVHVTAASAAALLPLATVSLRTAPFVLLGVALTVALSAARRIPYHLFAAVGVMFATVQLTGRGIGLLYAATALLGAVVIAAAITSRATGTVQLVTPAELFGTTALVIGLAVGEIARRSALIGVQLPMQRWALFALTVGTLAGLAANRAVAGVLGRKLLPAGTALVMFALVLLPSTATAGDLRIENGANATLAAMGGNGGGNSMTGEEGAGPRPQYRGVAFEACDQYSIRDCLITYFDDIANRKGLQASIDDIVDKVQNNVGRTFPTHCHQVVHNLGQFAYELADGNFELVSSYDPQVCGTGFIHGLYERYFNRYGKLLYTDTDEICSKMNLVQPWYAWTCNHILGHTLMKDMMSNPNVGSEFCLKMLDSPYFGDCESGAWMNFFSDDAVIAWFRANAMNEPEKVFNICYGAEANAKFFCYQEMFPLLTTISNDNLPLMARWCREYSEPARGSGVVYAQTSLNYAERCMQGVARVVAVANGYDYRVSMLRCVELQSDQADTCLSGAGASVVLNTGSVSAGMEMCERVKNVGYREYCFIWVKQVGATLRSGPNSQNMPKFGEIRIPDRDVLVPLPDKQTEAEPARKG